MQKLTPYLIGAFFMAVWLLVASMGWIPKYIVPHPAAIVRTLAKHPGDMADAVLVTLTCSLTAILFGAVFAFLAAWFSYRYPMTEQTIVTIMIGLKTVPIIALAPLVTTTIGANWCARLILTMAVCISPLILGALDGVKNISSEMMLMVSGWNWSERDCFQRLVAPSVLSHVRASLRVAIPLSFIGTVIAEMFGGNSQGIGYRIIAANYQLDVPMLYAATFVLVIVSLFTYHTVSFFAALKFR